ncbi:uncharacterized protein F4822DRAFT_392795 [Hypoxylon trugodes]|uniref:uncharacterized protein n=1 Tax=Hypoxylon trugodes TaxID=326681 RepID=UPI0021993814|nr:uncharacterized protein F4822DRAFT_392795 [Hypoxylon trugodes]KAI1392996.1 hypothetical protein F4822DRAFT_392795 [Hypoxylon trugodes]
MSSNNSTQNDGRFLGRSLLRRLTEKVDLSKRNVGPPSISKVQREATVSQVNLRPVTPVIGPNSPLYVNQFGGLRTRSPSVSSAPAQLQHNKKLDTTIKPLPVTALSSIKDPEVKSRVEHIVNRFELEDRTVPYQVAYDALRMAKGSVDKAISIIMKGEHIFSSADDDPEVREYLESIGVLPKKKKRVQFSDVIIYWT